MNLDRQTIKTRLARDVLNLFNKYIYPKRNLASRNRK